MKKKFVFMMLMAFTSIVLWAQPSTFSASPRKSALNIKAKATGKNVWYAKPEGTFYKNAYPAASLVVPPFTELSFENKCADVAASSWSLNGETQSNGTATFVASYPALHKEATFPMPQLSVGTDTFALGRISDGKIYTDGTIMTTSAISNLSKTDYVVGGSYIGWADLPGFPFKGSRDLDGDGVKEDFEFHTLVQHYPKPTKPFYLSALRIPFSSYQTEKDMIPEGKEVTVRIDEGTYGNTVATGHITKADIDLTSWNEGDPINYAGPTVTFDEGPIVINDMFFIVVEGLEECVQMGFWITLPAEYEQETEEFRTRTEGYDKDGNYKFTTWSSTSNNVTSYWEAVIYLIGMFDMAEIDSTSYALTASAEGGEVNLTFRSAQPFVITDGEGEQTPTYTIEGLPEWLTIQSVEDTEDHLTRLTLLAQPYNGPTPDGREVAVRLRSDYGVCTDDVTISQIPKVGDHLTTLSDEGRNVCFTITDMEDYACEITDYDIPEDGSITIPASIWEFEVTGIADQAFADRDDLTDITIDFAYNSCGGNIGKEAFKGCTNLQTITIGENTSSIGDNAFAGCANVTKVVSMVSERDLWSFNDNAFDTSVYEEAMLIVPDEKIEQYQTTNGWSNFQKIMDAETAADIRVNGINALEKATDIYLLDGRHTDKMQRGINIIRMDNGSVKKITSK